MSGLMPHRDYEWMTEAERDDMLRNAATVNSDGDTGYILECDIDYPYHLHDLHNDYPLAPEKLTITEDMISQYSKDRLEEMSDGGRVMTWAGAEAGSKSHGQAKLHHSHQDVAVLHITRNGAQANPPWSEVYPITVVEEIHRPEYSITSEN